MTNKYGKTLSKNVESLKTRLNNQSPSNCASCNNSANQRRSATL